MKKVVFLVLFFSLLISACGNLLLEEGQVVELKSGSLIKAAVDLRVDHRTCTTQGDQKVVIAYIPGKHKEDNNDTWGLSHDHFWIKPLTGSAFACEEGSDSLAKGWVFTNAVKP